MHKLLPEKLCRFCPAGLAHFAGCTHFVTRMCVAAGWHRGDLPLADTNNRFEHLAKGLHVTKRPLPAQGTRPVGQSMRQVTAKPCEVISKEAPAETNCDSIDDLLYAGEH